MKTLRILTIALAASAAIGVSSAQAATVDPTVGTFGDLATVAPGATFGGSGIPTDATNYSVFSDGAGNELVLGLSITPRFAAPTPLNDGDGSFTVLPGLIAGITGWNFSFYAEYRPAVVGGAVSLDDLGLSLSYDLDAGTGTDIADLGIINLAAFVGTANLIEDSQNLTFGFLHTGIPGLVTPGVDTFDPNSGEYSFLIRATDFSGASADGIGVIANVAAVPLPAGLPLLLASLAGLGLLRRTRKS